MLNPHQSAIITRMLTEHIELNQYLFKYKIKDPSNEQIPLSSKCIHCNKNESTIHYLLYCKKYRKLRHKMWRNIAKHWRGFRNSYNHRLEYILFPYTIPDQLRITKQILIWKEILNFTKRTNRLNNLRFVDNSQI